MTDEKENGSEGGETMQAKQPKKGKQPGKPQPGSKQEKPEQFIVKGQICLPDGSLLVDAIVCTGQGGQP